MPWMLLFIAGLCEVAWAIGLKYTEGFTRLWPSVATLAAMALSVVLLGLAMRSLPVGTAYPSCAESPVLQGGDAERGHRRCPVLLSISQTDD